jgi:hypothetical protein
MRKALTFPSPLNHWLSGYQGGSKKDVNGKAETYRIIVDERGQLRIRHDTVESTIDIIGKIAMHLQVLNFSFKSAWFHEVRELRTVRKMLRGGRCHWNSKCEK